MDNEIQKEIDKENESLNKEIVLIGERLIKNSKDIAELEERLSLLLEERKEIEARVLSIGLSSFSLPTGEEIKLNNIVGASIVNIQEFVEYLEQEKDPLINKVSHTLNFRSVQNSNKFLEEIVENSIINEIPLETSFGINALILRSYITKKFEDFIKVSEKKTIDEKEEEAANKIKEIPGINVSVFKNVKLSNFGEKKSVFKRTFKK